MYQVLVKTPKPLENEEHTLKTWNLSFSSELFWLDTLLFHFWPECPKWNGRVWSCLRIWVYQVLAETPRPLENEEHTLKTWNPSFSSELVWLDTLPVHFWPECQKWNGSV